MPISFEWRADEAMKQLTFRDRPRRDGKRRKKPGRKPSPSAGVPHTARPDHSRWNPVHVTLRGTKGLPSFRQQLIYHSFERALRLTRRPDFRIVEYSIQHDHVHLIIEADDKDALARGMKSFSVRANRLFNVASGRRRGSVWSGRYHRSDLKSPRQVRNALAYCLNNARKHRVITNQGLVIDPCSSARWFAGWSLPRTAREGPSPAEPARTALLRYLWQKHGLIHPTETPGIRPAHDDSHRSAKGDLHRARH